MSDVWPMVHAERAALLADLEAVEPARFTEPSLCPGWTVHDVLAHVIDTARTTRVGFVVGLARAGFDFDRQNAVGVERERGATPADTLEGLRRCLTRTSTPPAPRDTRLVEAVVHGEDIRRPLGIAGSYPEEAVLRALRLQVRTSTSMGGARELVAGVRLRASDADLVIGDGPEVTGPALALLLAVSGRPVAPGEIDGPGAAALTAR